MELISVSCNHCGAPLEVPPGANYVTCAHCGSRLAVKRTGSAVYTELLERGCDAAVFVGMHARAGTPDGVLCHTISTTTWRNLWFNDDLVGESGINAALCGHYGCPVLFVSGDEAVAREVKALLGNGLTTVAVKRGFTRYSARQIPPRFASLRRGVLTSVSCDCWEVRPCREIPPTASTSTAFACPPAASGFG